MKNILGTDLQCCSLQPITGYFRDGYCRTDETDRGSHTVACIVDDKFLEFSQSRGNDLSTPNPAYHFPGLEDGDRWCLCALRWKEAYEAGYAPKVVLQATHERALDVIELGDLLAMSADVGPKE